MSEGMTGRRQFLIACSYLATAPALMATLFSSGDVHAANNEAPVANAEPATVLKTDAPFMQIQGWESPGEAENTDNDQMWLRLNSSWRGAWR